MKKSIGCIFCLFFIINIVFSQSRNIRIVITPNDSIFVWHGDTPEGGNREFSIEKAILLDFDNEKHYVYGVQSVCGRGECPDGIEVNYHANGMMESKGGYGFTTDIDSLKYEGSDGFFFNIGKVGDWYYWNDKGFLIRKEKWVKGKLVATTRFTTSVLANKKVKRKK